MEQEIDFRADRIPAMTDSDKAKVLDVLGESCFGFLISMNDTFAFACADVEQMSDYDLDRMAPLIAEYGHDALVAYAAVKRKAEPIDCRCNHKNERYRTAKKIVELIKGNDEHFMETL